MLSVKEKGQVFTPNFIVRKMIEISGILNSDIKNIKILEPSVGNGSFAIEILKIYFENLDKNEALNCIKNNFRCVELDLEISQLFKDELFRNFNSILTKFEIDSLFKKY